jgi:alpha-glucosidase
LPDGGAGNDAAPTLVQHNTSHPAWDQDGVHDVYRDWREVANRYTPERIFIAESWVSSNERLARYLRPDELHTAFQFDFLRAPWRAEVLRTVVDDAIAAAATVGAPPTWVLSNHDVTRTVTRYARSQPDRLIETDWERGRWGEEPADLDVGVRRARAAALMQLALPGTAYVYQGEELGLEEVEDLPDEVRQDPIWVQSGYTDLGRDGCRVPLPWSGDVAPFGFSATPDVQTWLPQPARWAARTAEAEDGDPDSTLNLYREALAARSTLWVEAGELEWIATPPEVAAFRRGNAQCWVNTGQAPVVLPTDAMVVLASVPGTTTKLPADATAWLVTPVP